MSLLACVHMPIQSFVITLIFNVFRVLRFINREYMILDFKYTTTHVYLWINKYFVIHNTSGTQEKNIKDSPEICRFPKSVLTPKTKPGNSRLNLL